MTDSRAGRGRLFLGSVVLAGAVAACLTGLFADPIEPGHSPGIEHVRTSVVTYMRNSAIATLVLVALAALLLFPRPRLRHPLRDRVLIGLSAALVAFSVYRLVWLQTISGSIAAPM